VAGEEGGPVMPNPKHEADVGEEKVCPEFSFDDLKILGADNEMVFLEGEVGDYQPCVIKTSRDTFKEALTYFIDEKADYYMRSKKFCGVMSSLQAREFVELPPRDRCSLLNASVPEGCVDPDVYVPKKVRTFLVMSFGKETNVEHG
jgi:hypothetical protein